MSKTHRLELTNDDIELILDHLARGLTDAEYQRDPKGHEATYEVYQTIGQAFGEENIILEFVEASQPKKGKKE